MNNNVGNRTGNRRNPTSKTAAAQYLRHVLGLTFRQLADVIGIDQRTICGYMKKGTAWELRPESERMTTARYVQALYREKLR